MVWWMLPTLVLTSVCAAFALDQKKQISLLLANVMALANGYTGTAWTVGGQKVALAASLTAQLVSLLTS
jgi:hypothetical protein